MAKNKLKYYLASLFIWIPIVRVVLETRYTQTPVFFKVWIIQKIFGFNKSAYWPVHHSSVVTGVKNIRIGIATAPGNSNGCYIQGGGRIIIGDYTIIGPNVGIISSNHVLTNNQKKERKLVEIGAYSWIGMGAIILPGVELGEFTIVAAGSVVTKSFKEGYCVIAGNPARIIKTLCKEDCVKYSYKHDYYGYIPASKWNDFSKKLNI